MLKIKLLKQSQLILEDYAVYFRLRAWWEAGMVMHMRTGQEADFFYA